MSQHQSSANNEICNNKIKLLEKLLKTMEITTDARFKAGDRLKRLHKLSFITTTIISLGLILIPLLNSAGHNIVFSDSTLNSFQIFLAVCVLVFSVATSTAKYELRSKEFFDCADQIKSVCQDLKLAMIEGAENVKLDDFEKKYREILNGTESHENIDYLEAYKKRKIKESENHNGNINFNIRIFFNFDALSERAISILLMYLAPLFLWISELIFITDMIGVTEIFKILHSK